MVGAGFRGGDVVHSTLCYRFLKEGHVPDACSFSFFSSVTRGTYINRHNTQSHHSTIY